MNSKGKVRLVVDYIEKAIIESDGAGDFRLPSEREIAKKTGVSRATVREAIQRVASRGKIMVKQGSGIYVTHEIKAVKAALPWQQLLPEDELSHADIVEFQRVNTYLISRLAAKNATEDDIVKLCRIIFRIRRSADTGDFAELAACNAEFWMALIGATRNPMVDCLVGRLKNLAREPFGVDVLSTDEVKGLSEGWLSAYVDIHESICRAICDRDPDAAESAAIQRFELLERLSDHRD